MKYPEHYRGTFLLGKPAVENNFFRNKKEIENISFKLLSEPEKFK